MEQFELFPLMLIRRAGLPGSWLAALATLDDAPYHRYERTVAARHEAANALHEAFDAALAAAPATGPWRTDVYNARKEFHQRQVLRPATLARLQQAPREAEALHPAIAQFQTATQAAETARLTLEAAYSQALDDNYRLLQQAAGKPALQRGLLFASHDLLRALPEFASNPHEQWTKKQRQTALSLLHYLTRAAAKTSPLSHFTTVSLWRGQTAPSDEELPFSDKKSAVVPSVALLPLLYAALLREPAFYRSLNVVLNASITAADEPPQWLHYADAGTHETIQTLDAEETVRSIVELLLARGRRLGYTALLDAVAERFEAEAADAEAFVGQLLDAGLLEWQWPEPGLGTGWAGGLQNYLGFLPAEPVIVEAAALLQWLRTTARTLPYQSIPDAMAAQAAARHEIAVFLGKYAPESSDLPPAEQVFYEDVAESTQAAVPVAAVRQLTGSLAGWWREKPVHRVGGAQGAVLGFARRWLRDGARERLLDFCRAFLSATEVDETPIEVPAYRGKIGALVQFFEEHGQWKAVVNGLFPGGGRLFARWLHLFPAEVREQLAGWFPADKTPFPWQGWHNASLQPVLTMRTLAMPGGRVDHGVRSAFLLGDVEVAHRGGEIQLVDRRSDERIAFVDLGLEAAPSRPPVVQLLGHLGTPYVTVEALLPEQITWQTPAAGWSHRPRVERHGIVAARAVWRVESDAWRAWPAGASAEAFYGLRTLLETAGVPRRFFARFAGEKPLYFDADSPVLMLAFLKLLKGKSGALFLTEVLPVPAEFAEEIVLEFS